MVDTSLLSLYTFTARSVPISLTPPAIYNAWNTEANEDKV